MAGPRDPAGQFFAITPGTAFPACRGIYVGVGGDITVQGMDGNQATFKDVPTGNVLPVRGNLVVAATTTATNLIGLV